MSYIRYLFALGVLAVAILVANMYVQFYKALEIARTNNKSLQLRNITAVIVGGTSGIGQYTALKLAEHTSVEKIIITGRNKAAGDEIVQNLNHLTNSTNNEFIPCDVTLMKNIREYTDLIKSKLTKLNYLVLSSSPSSGSLFTRIETEEGIDKNMATSFYGRFLIIKELLPLLEKAAEDGEEARVLSILAAGRESAIKHEDLALKHDYGVLQLNTASVTYTSLTCEKFAALHPKISFMHIHPGWVDTPIVNLLPWYFSIPSAAISKVFATTQEECGEFMTYALTAEQYKTGRHLVNQRGDEMPFLETVNTKENVDTVWNHAIHTVSIGK